MPLHTPSSLQRLQFAVVVAFVASGGAVSAVGYSTVGSMIAMGGWLAGPLLLRALLTRLREQAGLAPDPKQGTLVLASLFLGFVGVPWMLIRTARDLARALGEPVLERRVRGLGLAYGVLAFAALPLSLLVPVVGVFAGPLVQLACLGLSTQMLITHVVDATSQPVPGSAAGTGHAAPVGIRTH